MGKQGKIRRTALGAFVSLSLIGLIGVCVYTSIYCEKNNPWQTYYPGRVGTLGGLAYAIAVTSIVSLFFFMLAFIFIIIHRFNIAKKVFVIIGSIVWFGCLICEILFISWNDWDIEKVVNDDIEDNLRKYANAFLNDVKVAFYDADYDLYEKVNMFGISSMSERGPPTFGKTLAKVKDGGLIVTKEISMPVCYFENEEDKKKFRPKECIGKWNGNRLKSYIKKLDDNIKDDSKMDNWGEDKLEKYHFTWTKTNVVMYSYMGAYAVVPLFVGAQAGALIFGVIYLLMSINFPCCGDSISSSD